MNSLYPAIVAELCAATRGHAFWEEYLAPLLLQQPASFAIHLAVFVEPYLQYVLEGKKTVESRFSTRRFAPYQQVDAGDVILLKQSGGPIVGICQVSYVWFYQLDPASWQEIQARFAQALCAQDPVFWQQRAHAAFATLMRVRNVAALPAQPVTKRDRRGWVVLHQTPQQLELAL